MADGYTAHACVDSATLKPTRVPDWLREAIDRVELSSSSSTSSS
jgi:acyl-CoA thioesterase FadM